MLFFQACLLGGYAYAHGVSRFLNIRLQGIIHVALLAAGLIFLPFAIPEGWVPSLKQDPTLWQLSLMATVIGVPFFVISASAPLFQNWFAHTDHPDAENPYFLYGASNLGSMTALLSYPFVIEPLYALSEQSQIWSLGYGVLIAMTLCALIFVIMQNRKTTNNAPLKNNKKETATSWGDRFRWGLLAFTPSSLMLGVTTYVTTDIASAPLLWIIPLALYVGSFIIVFTRKEVLSFEKTRSIFLVCLMVFLANNFGFKNVSLNPFLITGIHFIFFFSAALLCHQKLVSLKPSASRLTEFYLLMSFGGVLGGLFNSIIAPNIFNSPIEYPLIAFLACLVWVYHSNLHDFKLSSFKTFIIGLFQDIDKNLFTTIFLFGLVFALTTSKALPINTQMMIIGLTLAMLWSAQHLKSFFTVILSIAFITSPPTSHLHFEGMKTLHQERNFFGVLRVIETEEAKSIIHGTTLHGNQFKDEAMRLERGSYYSKFAPISDAFEVLNKRDGKQNIAVIGLGSGATACYSKEGRHFDFFEIDAAVVKVAENPEYFTYLQDCGSPYDIILGDGRLTIQDQDDEKYDLILIDAFSSDSIPVHLITKEAAEIYLSKLKDDGILLYHISNRHLDLESTLTMNAKDLDVPVYGKISKPGKFEGTELDYFATLYVMYSRGETVLKALADKGWSEGLAHENTQAWSDQYSNIIAAFQKPKRHKQLINADEDK